MCEGSMQIKSEGAHSFREECERCDLRCIQSGGYINFFMKGIQGSCYLALDALVMCGEYIKAGISDIPTTEAMSVKPLLSH